MRKIIIATVAAAAMLLPAAALAGPPDTTKVAICHYPGHEPADPVQFSGGFITGDYVVDNTGTVAEPDANPSFCEASGGEVIWVPIVAAERGHDVQLKERFDQYR